MPTNEEQEATKERGGRGSAWDEIAERLQEVADDLRSIALEVERLIVGPKYDTVPRNDPRRSILEAAKFASSVGWKADEIERMAARIDEGHEPVPEPSQ